jgi:hypothetical protein
MFVRTCVHVHSSAVVFVECDVEHQHHEHTHAVGVADVIAFRVEHDVADVVAIRLEHDVADTLTDADADVECDVQPHRDAVTVSYPHADTDADPNALPNTIAVGNAHTHVLRVVVSHP